jgi:hypothetical protein
MIGLTKKSEDPLLGQPSPSYGKNPAIFLQIPTHRVPSQIYDKNVY